MLILKYCVVAAIYLNYQFQATNNQRTIYQTITIIKPQKNDLRWLKKDVMLHLSDYFQIEQG